MELPVGLVLIGLFPQVRKKSAKLLEMEEFEGLEKKSHAKGASSKGTKKAKGKMTLSPVAEVPTAPAPGGSALHNLLNSPVATNVVFSAAPVAAVPAAPMPAISVLPSQVSPPESLKLRLNLSAMAASQNPLVSPPGQLPPPPPSKSEKKAKAKSAKKSKPAGDITSQIATVGALIKNSQAKQEADHGLKLTLKIPPSKEAISPVLPTELTGNLQGVPAAAVQRVRTFRKKKKKKQRKKKYIYNQK